MKGKNMAFRKIFWAGAALVALSSAASAHSFSVALLGGGAGGVDQLQSAVRGFLVASAENDGHSDETADGHLGGLDVFLSPLPTALAADITGLMRQPTDLFDLVVVLDGNATLENQNGVEPTTVVVAAGTLPAPAQRADFIQAYQARFATMPDEAAAQGYNAARRIDQAVRLLGGAEQSAAFSDALAATQGGIDWQAK